MVVLLIGASVATAIVLGWTGYRVSLRIKAWGEAMNACDEIFRSVTEGRVEASLEDDRELAPARVLQMPTTRDLRPTGTK